MERCAGSLRPAITAAVKTDIFPACLNGSYNHVTSSELRNRVICKTASVYINSLTIYVVI